MEQKKQKNNEVSVSLFSPTITKFAFGGKWFSVGFCIIKHLHLYYKNFEK